MQFISNQINDRVIFMTCNMNDMIYYLNLYEEGVINDVKYIPNINDKNSGILKGYLYVTLYNPENYYFGKNNEYYLVLDDEGSIHWFYDLKRPRYISEFYVPEIYKPSNYILRDLYMYPILQNINRNDLKRQYCNRAFE
jgi:hypothetical protein